MPISLKLHGEAPSLILCKKVHDDFYATGLRGMQDRRIRIYPEVEMFLIETVEKMLEPTATGVHGRGVQRRIIMPRSLPLVEVGQTAIQRRMDESVRPVVMAWLRCAPRRSVLCAARR